MPRVIPTDVTEAIELGDLVERLETEPFDPRDEDNFASWGPALKKLANNRTFLGDIIVEELKSRCENQLETNRYTPQVILLHSRSKHFIIRANIWPALDDSMVKESGTDPFFYGKAHDHNFSFLTVGYMGPGYWSEYYEYDYAEVAGYPGEKVGLRYVERSRLEEGKVMLYRIHRDVHLQLPADEMSVSINILESGPTNHFLDQYQFDVQKSEVVSILTHTSIEPLLSLSAQMGGEEGMALVEDFAAAHPSDQIRFHALKARAAAAGGLDERIALFERAARSHNRYVSTMAKIEAGRLEKGRAWLDGEHLKVA
jgi:hypothetical protein